MFISLFSTLAGKNGPLLCFNKSSSRVRKYICWSFKVSELSYYKIILLFQSNGRFGSDASWSVAIAAIPDRTTSDCFFFVVVVVVYSRYFTQQNYFIQRLCVKKTASSSSALLSTNTQGTRCSFNPLSPIIHIQILQTDPHTFPYRISWENLFEDQSIFPLEIILFFS